MGERARPRSPVTRYKDPREVALDIFTTNGSLSVDGQAVVITNSLGLLRCGHMAFGPVIPINGTFIQ